MIDQTQMQLADWLDDLTVRFLLNLPASELSSMPRLCFQVEEAQWFYEDFIRPMAAAAGSPLPSLALRQFCLLLFQHCPLLNGFTDAQLVAAYESFLAYKVRVPVRGAILMTWDMERLLLVKGWKKGASWSFPRGKINQEEKDLDCAIREVYEETGYDVRQAGLVPTEESSTKYIDVAIREQHVRLFVFRGVPEDTHFEPKTRKEISKISWYNIRDLPGFRKQKQGVDQMAHANKFYMVAPFLGPLKKWINQQRRDDAALHIGETAAYAQHHELLQSPEFHVIHDSIPQHQMEHPNHILRTDSIQPQSEPMAGERVQASSANLLALLHGLPQASMTESQHDTENPIATRMAMRSDRAQNMLTSNYTQPDWPQTVPADKRNPLHDLDVNGSSSQARGSHATYGTHAVEQGEPFQFGSESTRRSSAALRAQVGLQGQFGAIGSAPEAPKAEALPHPTLSAHSMNLLNAFRSSSQAPSQGMSQANSAQKSNVMHQTALLDLFKRPSRNMPAGPDECEPTEPAEAPKRATTDTKSTEHDTTDLENVATREPEIQTMAIPLPKLTKGSETADRPRRDRTPRHGIPNQSTSQMAKPARKVSAAPRPAPPMPVTPIVIMQRSSTSQTTSPSIPATRVATSAARQTNSPKASNRLKRPDTRAASQTQPQPTQFTILARPNPVKDGSVPSQEIEQPVFQPQLLKRVEPNAQLEVESTKDDAVSRSSPKVKKDGLLALFEKKSVLNEQFDASSPSSPPTASSNQADARRANLLALLGATSAPSRGVAPPASKLPSPRQNSQAGSVTTEPRKQILMDLIHQQDSPKPARIRDQLGSSASSLAGTPFQKADALPPRTSPHPVIQSRSPPPRSNSVQTDPTRSRLNSAVSVKDSVTSPGGSGHATPIEAREFLLDFLNGVVQKEGHRGRVP